MEARIREVSLVWAGRRIVNQHRGNVDAVRRNCAKGPFSRNHCPFNVALKTNLTCPVISS
jgi:hypothetical protein